MLKSEARTDRERQKQLIRERYGEQENQEKMFVIPASEQPINIYEDDQPRRVAVYVRVSTDSVQQTSSYELQKNYYTSFVESHKNWRLVRIYADEGISGTSLNHRDEFNRMIDDCSKGAIDLIVTKSVSRFARNIVDCISMVRRLRSLHPPVGVYFEAEHIFTLKNDTDMSLAFTATMAEEESHTKSTIMNMSVQMRFGLGKYLTPTLLGYTHDDKGNLIINEDEAPIVRLIFFMYLYGYSCQQIADKLGELQVKTRTGKSQWSGGTILQILRNERHCGDIRAGKTYTPDFHTHRSVRNKGQRPIYGMYDHHDPIISRDDFIAVQKMLNNAKYGGKGVLPELRVVTVGALQGFVSVNPRWAAFKAQDYLNASSAASASNGEEENPGEFETTGEAGEFDFRGYEIARSQFFESQAKLCSTFSMEKISFTIDCIRKLNNAGMIEVLVHPFKKLIAIRPAGKGTRNAVKWVRYDGRGSIQPKPVPCSACMGTIFDLFGWNKECRYRIHGAAHIKDQEMVLIYHVEDAEALIPPKFLVQQVTEGEDKLQEEMVPLALSGKKHVIAFPEKWSGSFGVDVYAYQQKKAASGFQGENWRVNAAAISVSSHEYPNVTAPEIVASHIESIIGTIRQEGSHHVE